jgi:predicted glutamine amidotransferase
MLVNENNSQPYMKSLATCLNKVVHDGYTENFKVTESGLQSVGHDKVYSPDQVEVINFFRFEGSSNPDDEAVLYVIKTKDGTKGTLTDAYGVYMDPVVSSFMKNVDHFHKKNQKN